MHEIKPIVRSLAVAFGGYLLVSAGAFAQQAPAAPAQTLQKITITGSNISRVDTETVAPVTVITREDIERSGQPTVADVIRNIPANSGNSYSESFSNSFAPGASGVSLRGLGQKATLTLINGRRIAGYGFAQNLQDTFVDLNSIPSSAVERIDILRDGASAIYGSDAIAGVVNVVLRNDYQGIEAGVNGGIGTNGASREYRANLTGGFGSLAEQRYNVFGVVDFYKRDELLMKDVPGFNTRDFRQYAGGTNAISLTGGGTWQNITNTTTGATGFERRARQDCPTANTLNYAQASAAGLINDQRFNLPSNSWCTYDSAQSLSALPATQRVGFLGRAQYEISNQLTAFADLMLSRVETQQTFTPSFVGTTALKQTPAGLKPYSFNVNLAPGAGGNPFATAGRYVGNLDLGTRDADITSDSYRILGGLKGSYKFIDFDTSVGYSKNDVTAAFSNRVNKSALYKALGLVEAANPLLPPIPISSNSSINFNNQGSTQAALNAAAANFSRKSTSELFSADFKGSSQLFELPGGTAAVAYGVEYRDEKLNDEPAAIALAGDVLGQGITKTIGSRTNTAVYAELALPVTSMIEAQAALRHDRYSDYGTSTVPKVGLKFKPFDQLLFRANWGKGFRAPSLPEISPSTATFFVSVNDTPGCALGVPGTCTGPVQISGVYAGNPNLQAEKSTSGVVGFVFEPTRNSTIAVDYYQLTWNNLVGADSFQTLVNRNDPTQVIRDPGNNGIVTVLNGYRNFGEVKTSGIDMEFTTRQKTEIGTLTWRIQGSYLTKYEQDGDDYVGNNGYGSAFPRFRGFTDLALDRGALYGSVRLNYTMGYDQELLAPSAFTGSNPSPRRLAGVVTTDLFGRYNLNKNLSVTAAVNNLFNVRPPYDAGQATYRYDFTLYSITGRFFRLGANYKF